MAEWSLLPKDLLEQISDHLHTSIDLLRFRSVCSSWRSSVPVKPSSQSASFRFVLNDQNNRILGASFGFYLTKRTIFLIKSPSTPDSWLVKIEEDSSSRKKHFLHPLSRYHPLNSFPRGFPRCLDLSNFRIFELGQEYVLHHASSRSIPDAGNLYMEKVVITWLNRGSHFLLLTIHVSGKLALFRSFEKEWTIIKEMPSPYDDVIVYNEKFYAVDNTGRTVCVDPNADLKLIANPVFGGDKKYLVESRGQLLLVDMYLSIDTADGNQSGVGEEFLEHLAQYMNERTVRFKVFKLDEALQTWNAMSCLDDFVLFLGDDSCFSASAADLPGCGGNRIFFVDNYPRNENANEEEDGVLAGGHIGVFDLGSSSIGPISDYPEYSQMFWPPPAWVSFTSLEVQTQNQLEDLSLVNNEPADI